MHKLGLVTLTITPEDGNYLKGYPQPIMVRKNRAHTKFAYIFIFTHLLCKRKWASLPVNVPKYK